MIRMCRTLSVLERIKLMRMHACASRSFTVLHYDYTYIHVSIVIKLRQNDFKNPFELYVFVIMSREETSRLLPNELFYYSTTIDLHIIMDMHQTQ